jgi:hypothetical protein
MITNEKFEMKYKESFVLYFKLVFLQLSEDAEGNHRGHSFDS